MFLKEIQSDSKEILKIQLQMKLCGLTDLYLKVFPIHKFKFIF